MKFSLLQREIVMDNYFSAAECYRCLVQRFGAGWDLIGNLSYRNKLGSFGYAFYMEITLTPLTPQQTRVVLRAYPTGFLRARLWAAFLFYPVGGLVVLILFLKTQLIVLLVTAIVMIFMPFVERYSVMRERDQLMGQIQHLLTE